MAIFPVQSSGFSQFAKSVISNLARFQYMSVHESHDGINQVDRLNGYGFQAGLNPGDF
jgi:hypothetical protein